MKINIQKPVSSSTSCNPEDVRLIKRSLNWLGYYMPYKKIGLSNLPDKGLFTALKDFQKDNNLCTDAQVKPNGETIEVINKELAKQLKGEGA